MERREEEPREAEIPSDLIVFLLAWVELRYSGQFGFKGE